MVISVADILQYMQPVILTVLGTIWAAASPTLITIIQRKLKFSLTQDQWNVIHSAAQIAGNEIWARAEPSIVNHKFEIRDPRIVTAARVTTTAIPEVMKGLGLTPEYLESELEKLIMAHLGRLQASAVTAPVAVPVKE